MKREGYWWRTMGFTRTHVVGVFVTESLLTAAGILLIAAAALVPESRISLLLAANASVLLAIAVLLSSILSLLFFKWFGPDECA